MQSLHIRVFFPPQEGIVTDGDGPYRPGIDSCVWIIAPAGARSITLNFSFFNTIPDTVQTVSIDSCLDVLCNKPTPLSGSPYRYLPESLNSNFANLPLVTTGIARVTYLSMWSGHTQARFVLSYTSGSKLEGTCSGLRPTAWNYVAAVLKVVGDAILARLYVNGTLVAATSAPKPVDFNLMLAGGGGMALGRAHPMSAPFGHYSGLIDELSIFNRSLSEAELILSMNTSCNNITDAVSCFSFDLDLSYGGSAFVDSGSGEPSDAIAVAADKFLPWCSTRDDGGSLLIEVSSSVFQYGLSWGFCTEKIRLPGLGFDYNPDQLFIGNSISNFGDLVALPGCVNLPLVVQGNVARRCVPPPS
jgi:hypothetical protein